MAEVNETPKPAEKSASEAGAEQPAGAEEPVSAEQPAGVQEGQAAEEVSKDARTWAMFCHLVGLAGIVIPVVGNIVGPLVIWQIKKDEYPFVDEQGKSGQPRQFRLDNRLQQGSFVGDFAKHFVFPCGFYMLSQAPAPLDCALCKLRGLAYRSIYSSMAAQ